jgi:hypothetical protein
MCNNVMNLVHLAIAFFILYVGYLGHDNQLIHAWMYQALMALGALAILFHAAQYFGYIEKWSIYGKPTTTEVIPIYNTI